MNKRSRLSVGLALAAVLAVAAVGAAPRLVQTAQAAPACGGPGQPVTTPPARRVTAADFFTQADFDFEHGDCDAAVADYTQALALDPGLAEAYNNRAYTYMAQQNYAAALPDLNQAIALRPDYVNALMNRGDMHNYYYAIDYDQALADYNRVLALPHPATSVCGHRLLAQHHGWDLGVVLTVAFQGGAAGCQ